MALALKEFCFVEKDFDGLWRRLSFILFDKSLQELLQNI